MKNLIREVLVGVNKEMIKLCLSNAKVDLSEKDIVLTNDILISSFEDGCFVGRDRLTALTFQEFLDLCDLYKPGTIVEAGYFIRRMFE